MNIEELREYCITVTGAEESFPFDDTILVYKVMGKMFAVIGLEHTEDGFSVIVKCDPQKAIELREKYQSVLPGYHFNKKYWNSIYLEGDMSSEEIQFWINHSVDEVIKKLPKKAQAEYQAIKNADL